MNLSGCWSYLGTLRDGCLSTACSVKDDLIFLSCSFPVPTWLQKKNRKRSIREYVLKEVKP